MARRTIDFGRGRVAHLLAPDEGVDMVGQPAWQLLIEGTDAVMATEGLWHSPKFSRNHLIAQVMDDFYQWISSSAVGNKEAEIKTAVSELYDEYHAI